MSPIVAQRRIIFVSLLFAALSVAIAPVVFGPLGVVAEI